MIRRLIAMSMTVLALTLFSVGLAEAGESPTEVLPEEIEREAPPQVLDTQAQPLPRTGSDISIEVIAGIVLIAAGGTLAVGARRRRTRLTVSVS